LVGVGFIAQGLDRGTYFARKPDSHLPETEWIFEGVASTERIGDFGAAEGGAAGLEVDWYDPKLGSPGWAHVVAASEGHSRLMLEVRENVGETLPYMGGDMDPRVRADMVYFKTVSGGAVFSTGSISWCGSLAFNNYDNNVSRIMRNVIDRFAGDEPLP
jgi:N,N-dimethylformamidase